MMHGMMKGMGFVGGTIDRADHLRRDPAAMKLAMMHPSARFLLFDRLKPLLDPSGSALCFLRRAEVPDGTMVFLGLDGDGVPHFAVDGSANGQDGRPTDARAAATRLSAPEAALVAQGRSLLDWHARHGFCAACGAPTQLAKGGYGRSCGACGAEHFPRVDPVVIMLATRDDMALVGRQPGFPPGFFSALAGFVEPGESLEEAVARELKEEAGIATLGVSYVASQPWPFPSSLMIGAMAEAAGFELVPDFEEMEEVRWVSRAECADALAGSGPWMAPPPLAIAHWLLRHWVETR
jgi:NAD+ diphosphatase